MWGWSTGSWSAAGCRWRIGHFEQNIHVRHRLDRHRAGRHLDYTQACDPDALAAAITEAPAAAVDYLPVRTDGAARAAAMLAELV